MVSNQLVQSGKSAHPVSFSLTVNWPKPVIQFTAFHCYLTLQLIPGVTFSIARYYPLHITLYVQDVKINPHGCAVHAK